ncbi:CCCH zinc finger DNA binding protein [Beauveria bassiana ARSEF 2860]|uniref:CCCH zinc finger DNA binding protein n=1 Tax=Beauveria bassiana (strain ARSEF 2860) TaxID=655819 RepID=J4KNE0_BEAB2|nr:CCCH zinc finger DNA binding protein [Beauveria bassiana ARSEF 2860]EJP65539.1 CCCH zinc finger DNA binding protein [Beauveria bassiana ARSEF 2860]
MSKALPSKPAPSQDNIIAFVHRYNDLMRVRDSTDKLIEDILLYCQGLERALEQETGRLQGELHSCQIDLADANASRRELEQKLSHTESEMLSLYKENDTYKTRNPYIVVLIDGDGLLFQDAWIRQGVEGGKKAANALRSSVARQWTDKSRDTQIVAKVVADWAGLARSFRGYDLRDFATGFTQGHVAFDFVDIGSGKERRAEPKIRDNTRWHLRNQNCRQILLGVAPEGSYSGFLEDLFRTDPAARDRVSIIEGGVALTADLKATGANTTRLDRDLFRADKPVERIPVHAVSAAVGRTASPSGSVTSSGGGANSSTFSYAHAITNGTPPPTMSIPLAPNKPSPRPPRTSPHGTTTNIPSPSSPSSPQYQKIPPQQPDWNPGARGLDEPIIVNVAVMDAVKKRKDTDKLCNNHFLRGPCAKGDGCNFVHVYKPNAEEINAIAVLARQNPCTHGQDCENWECIYGHHCPSIRDGVCTHPYCKFDEDQHPPGTKFTLVKSGR